ncbi:MAG TPA: M14 metallopeptidase family protein, partial [Longimicrobiales bacterium]|nr:M14 metallopeptidase family protein [Longimicrobiales bacterium]
MLGYVPGADYRLTTYEESLEYFRALDAASDRIRLERVGRTTRGRDWYVALISSPENLARAEELRRLADRLAHPRSLTDDQARELAAEGRAIVDISGGLHATEVAGAEHTIVLAHELVASEDPRIAAIRENVITVLWPSLNPDGQTMVTEWYRGNVGTEFELAPLPGLYQEYVGHDNNRDAYMLNMVESRVLARVWQHWDPQIIHVHHQSSPFPTRIWVPPFAEPIATFAPPLISRTVNTLGMTIAQMLDARGLPGAVHMGTGFDAWYPGYVDYLPVLQHQAAFWTETALHRYATPREYTLEDFPENRRDLRTESLYTSPWAPGWWRLADAVEYMTVASIAVLDYAAKYREDLLFNRYQSGRDVVRKYTAEAPFAYLVPREQRDPVAPVELLRRLAFNGVEVHALTRPLTVAGRAWEAGDWVIAMDQPFAELARQVLSVQTYPDLREYPEGPPEQPYDAAGWTLPLQMDVEMVEAVEPLGPEVREAMTPVAGEVLAWDADAADAAPFDAAPGVGFDTDPVAAGILPLPGGSRGSGPALRLDPAEVNAYRVLNAAWDRGASVRQVPGGYQVTGLDEGEAEGLLERFAVRGERGAEEGTPLRRPRVALYRPWTASMDEGWTRWVLERYGFPSSSLRDAELRAGGLRDAYDVVVLPSERPDRLLTGHSAEDMPPEYVGGMGVEGVRALDAFVRDGGTLVCPSAAADLCIERLGLPVENVVAGLPRDVFFAAGSLLEVEVRTGDPLMAGMRARASIFFDRSPVFETGDGFQGTVLARYGSDGSPLRSGYLLG